jgi:hypothetical protein
MNAELGATTLSTAAAATAAGGRQRCTGTPRAGPETAWGITRARQALNIMRVVMYSWLFIATARRSG